jgi:hypothetical protein
LIPEDGKDDDVADGNDASVLQARGNNQGGSSTSTADATAKSKADKLHSEKRKLDVSLNPTVQDNMSKAVVIGNDRQVFPCRTGR